MGGLFFIAGGVAMTLPTEEQSSASDFKFALPDWPYDFWPLKPVAEAAFDRFT